MDITVPTRIVSEEPTRPSIYTNGRFPADYPILRIVTHTAIEYLRLSGRSRIWDRALNEFLARKLFPIKAPTRQMLYPLSYRGAFTFATRC